MNIRTRSGYYRCKCLTINGIGNEEINTIVDLVDEILEINWEPSNPDQTYVFMNS